MCNAGACERQTHRCFACGTVDGQPCCPPDAAQATARCIGERLSCEFDPQKPFFAGGTCIKCGIRGRPPCDWGCDPGLDMLKGLCEICGADGQVPCDKGCKPGLGMKGGVCRVCGGVNQIPCDNGCNGQLGVRQGLCVACGGSGQAPCDKGCNAGLRSINNVCTPCGGLNQPPCTNGCNYPYRVSGGVCKPCGHLGQVPCDVGCDGGLVITNNLCSTPSTSDPPACAKAARLRRGFRDRQTLLPSAGNSQSTVVRLRQLQDVVPRGQQCARLFSARNCAAPTATSAIRGRADTAKRLRHSGIARFSHHPRGARAGLRQGT